MGLIPASVNDMAINTAYTPMQRGEQILVVEDDAADFFLLEEHIRRTTLAPMEILHAVSMHEVLSLTGQIAPTVIFLDLSLPDCNGLETFLTADSLFPKSPIIVLSDVSETDSAMQALQAGAQDNLVKGDFDEKLLQKSVQYSIERKHGQLNLKENYKRYEWVFKATNDPLWDWNILTGEVYWNEKVNIFGFPETEKKNFSWRLANTHPEDINRITKELNEFLESNLQQWSGKYRFRCIDGKYKYVVDRGYVLRDKNNRAYRMIGSMYDITELKKTEEELFRSQEELRHLLTHLEKVREEERISIAREIHDELGQQFTVLKMDISWLSKKLAEKDESVREKISELQNGIDTTIKTIRKISSDLRPTMLDDLGLDAAMEWHCREFEKRSGIRTDFFSELNDLMFPAGISTGVFRIFQESLTNVARHAQAKQVNASVKIENGKLILKVSDNGKGFDPTGIGNNKTLGILGMRERTNMMGGEFIIHSTPGEGTVVEVRVPVSSAT